jgi:cytosine/adenosine deaminase-related metal-dependent hydrolase
LDDDGVWKYHWDYAAARQAMDYAIEIVKRYEGDHGDRVRTMLFPYQFDACAELLTDVKRASRELDVPIHMHTSQSSFEFHDCLRRYNKTPVQFLDSIRFMDSKTILTHLIYTTMHPTSGYPPGDTSDLRLVAASGAHVAHCSMVYVRRGKILGSFSRYRQMGINVPMGTDTFPQDMIEEMRWAALACKWVDRNANHGTAREVFNAATLDGARALGRDDIGRLAPGAKADIAIIDLNRLHIGPVDDPIKSLVYAASGSDVDTVLVDGRVVVEDGKIPGLNEAELSAKAADAHLWQKEQFAAQHPSGENQRKLFPNVYPLLGIR